MSAAVRYIVRPIRFHSENPTFWPSYMINDWCDQCHIDLKDYVISLTNHPKFYYGTLCQLDILQLCNFLLYYFFTNFLERERCIKMCDGLKRVLWRKNVPFRGLVDTKSNFRAWEQDIVCQKRAMGFRGRHASQGARRPHSLLCGQDLSGLRQVAVGVKRHDK